MRRLVIDFLPREINLKYFHVFWVHINLWMCDWELTVNSQTRRWWSSGHVGKWSGYSNWGGGHVCCGWHHSLTGILDCINREGGTWGSMHLVLSLLTDWLWWTTLCSLSSPGDGLQLWAGRGPFFLEMLLSGYFATTTKNETLKKKFFFCKYASSVVTSLPIRNKEESGKLRSESVCCSVSQIRSEPTPQLSPAFSFSPHYWLMWDCNKVKSKRDIGFKHSPVLVTENSMSTSQYFNG